MRPGEPPTLETAEGLFKSLIFDAERYDLSAVGRVKMNARLGFETEDSLRVLRKEDILEVVRTMVEMKDGRGDIDDIDHLGNRRVRSVGELMENQYRVGLLRMERAIRERMSSVDIDTVMPHDLINASWPLLRLGSSLGPHSSANLWIRQTHCRKLPISDACRLWAQGIDPRAGKVSRFATCIQPIMAGYARSRRRKVRTSALSIHLPLLRE